MYSKLTVILMADYSTYYSQPLILLSNYCQITMLLLSIYYVFTTYLLHIQRAEKQPKQFGQFKYTRIYYVFTTYLLHYLGNSRTPNTKYLLIFTTNLYTLITTYLLYFYYRNTLVCAILRGKNVVKMSKVENVVNIQ